MLHTLLLQASTHTSTVEVTSLNNVYLALGGTFAAALLATWASWNAAKTAERTATLSSATAQKVADLSRQTTKEVADLSAQVSRESAGLAAQTARELKETDYKNDFYKKIIEKRLGAWEEAQELVRLMANNSEDSKDGLTFPEYFSSEKKFDEVILKMRSMIAQTIWLGRSYAEQSMAFHNTLIKVRTQCAYPDRKRNESGELSVNPNLLAQEGKQNRNKWNLMLSRLIGTLGAVIRNLHEVESYLNELNHLGTSLAAGDMPPSAPSQMLFE